MLNCPSNTNNIITGAQYFFKGACLIWHPKLRPFILIPLIVNVILFIGLSSLFLSYIDSFSAFADNYIASWLGPLVILAWIVIGIILFLIYAYSFNLITNIIAAPFYGILAEKAEGVICGTSGPEESLRDMVPRVLARELRKVFYFLSRGILIGLIVLLLSLTFGAVPILQFAGPLLGLGWGAWSMTIQYVDYAADNHQHGFKDLRRRLWKKMFGSLGFGGAVMGFTIIPIVNIFVMPAAVVGGTLFWIHELKGCDECPEAQEAISH